MGRPTVMTPEVIAKLEEAFAWGCTDREACLWAGVSEEALYLYQGKNPEFTKRKEALKDTVILKSRKNVSDRIQKGDVDTAKWVLERKKKDEYSLRKELTGEDGKDLGVAISAEQAEQLIRARANRSNT